MPVLLPIDTSLLIARSAIESCSLDTIVYCIRHGIVRNNIWSYITSEDCSLAAKVANQQTVRQLHDYGAPPSALSAAIDGRDSIASDFAIDDDEQFVNAVGSAGMAVLTRDTKQLMLCMQRSSGHMHADNALGIATARDYHAEVKVISSYASPPGLWDNAELASRLRYDLCMSHLFEELSARPRVLCMSQHGALSNIASQDNPSLAATASILVDRRVLNMRNMYGRRPIEYALNAGCIAGHFAAGDGGVEELIMTTDSESFAYDVIGRVGNNTWTQLDCIIHASAARGWRRMCNQVHAEQLWRERSDLGPAILSAVRNGHREIVAASLAHRQDLVSMSGIDSVCNVLFALLNQQMIIEAGHILARTRSHITPDMIVYSMARSSSNIDTACEYAKQLYKNIFSLFGIDRALQIAAEHTNMRMVRAIVASIT